VFRIVVVVHGAAGAWSVWATCAVMPDFRRCCDAPIRTSGGQLSVSFRA
jgi:hypothetical protein